MQLRNTLFPDNVQWTLFWFLYAMVIFTHTTMTTMMRISSLSETGVIVVCQERRYRWNLQLVKLTTNKFM